MRTGIFAVAILLASGSLGLQAEDWPEYRGAGRMGVWNETGIIEKFPESGLKIKWRTPLNRGYTGPAVSNGRITLSVLSEFANWEIWFYERLDYHR